MFRLLKLKPPHGWNAVVWELAIVTLGVLIALGAQQVVQWLTDRSTAAETRAEVTDELNSDLMSIALRRSAEPCIDRRLAELRVIVAEWERTGSFKTPRWVAQSPVIETELGRYDAALSAGRLSLLSGEEQYRMGAVANRIRKFGDWQFAERLPWGRLRSLQFGAEALSADDRAAIRCKTLRRSTMRSRSIARRRFQWRGVSASRRTRRAFASLLRRYGQGASSRPRSARVSTRLPRKQTSA